jgi:hypothetical protein
MHIWHWTGCCKEVKWATKQTKSIFLELFFPAHFNVPDLYGCRDVSRSIHDAYVRTVFNASRCTNPPKRGRMNVIAGKKYVIFTLSLSPSLSQTMELLPLFMNTSPKILLLFPFCLRNFSTLLLILLLIYSKFVGHVV